MKSENRNNILLSAAVVLFVALFAIGCASCRNKKAEATPINETDSIEQPQPLHPPIVIPHSWREEVGSADKD